jgi:bacillithiol system protein YtxJ
MLSITPLAEKSLPADCLVFKHSTTCPVSAGAAEQVRTLDAALPLYWINVREQRDLSDWVAEAYGVTHESPQLILIQGGARKKVWNHYAIIVKDVAPALGRG